MITSVKTHHNSELKLFIDILEHAETVNYYLKLVKMCLEASNTLLEFYNDLEIIEKICKKEHGEDMRNRVKYLTCQLTYHMVKDKIDYNLWTQEDINQYLEDIEVYH